MYTLLVGQTLEPSEHVLDCCALPDISNGTTYYHIIPVADVPPLHVLLLCCTIYTAELLHQQEGGSDKITWQRLLGTRSKRLLWPDTFCLPGIYRVVPLGRTLFLRL